jgi:hypothetical protein
MKRKDKNLSKKSGKFIISIVLYVVASVVAIAGVALIVNNIFLFKNTVSQYVAQGYSAQTVMNELMTSQLLPGILEPVAVYGGIAFLLLGAGIINKKVSKCLTLLTKVEVCNNVIKESILEENVEAVDVSDQNFADAENAEKAQQTEISSEDIKA